MSYYLTIRNGWLTTLPLFSSDPNDDKVVCYYDTVMDRWQCVATIQAVRVKVRNDNKHYRTVAIFRTGHELHLKRPDGSITPMVLHEKILEYQQPNKAWQKWPTT